MKKRSLKSKTDKGIEKVLRGDLSSQIRADNMFPPTFEFAPKNKVINLRVSEGLFAAIKKMAKARGIPYQRYIREILERSIKPEK